MSFYGDERQTRPSIVKDKYQASVYSCLCLQQRLGRKKTPLEDCCLLQLCALVFSLWFWIWSSITERHFYHKPTMSVCLVKPMLLIQNNKGIWIIPNQPGVNLKICAKINCQSYIVLDMRWYFVPFNKCWAHQSMTDMLQYSLFCIYTPDSVTILFHTNRMLIPVHWNMGCPGEMINSMGLHLCVHVVVCL